MVTSRRRAPAVIVSLVVGVLASACGTRVQEVSTTTPDTTIVERVVDSGASVEPGADGAGDQSSNAAPGAPSTGADGSGTTGADGNDTDAGVSAGSTAAAQTCPSGPTGEPIRLGAVGSQSGIVGAALEGGFRGLAVWQQWANAHGGVQCRPVEIIFVDDGSDPGKHAAAVRRLIREEGVVAFIGNIAPFTFSAGEPLLEENNVPALGGEAADAGWFRSPVAFPINGQTISRSRPAAKWAIANLSERKAATIFVNEADAPARIAENFADEWKRQGGEVVLNAGVSLVTVDFTSEVIEARDRGAEILFLVLEKSACTRWFNAQRRQRYKPVVISTACTIDNARDAKDLLTGRFYAAHAAKPVLAGRSAAEDEVLAAIARYDPSLAPDGAFMFGWLAGKLFEAAMAQEGAEVSGPGIIDALHQLPPTDLGGLTPSQSWPPGPHPEGECGMVSSFDGQNFNLETPEFIC